MKKLVILSLLAVLCFTGMSFETNDKKFTETTIAEEVQSLEIEAFEPDCSVWTLKLVDGHLMACRICSGDCAPTCFPVEECRDLGSFGLHQAIYIVQKT